MIEDGRNTSRLRVMLVEKRSHLHGEVYRYHQIVYGRMVIVERNTVGMPYTELLYVLCFYRKFTEKCHFYSPGIRGSSWLMSLSYIQIWAIYLFAQEDQIFAF